MAGVGKSGRKRKLPSKSKSSDDSDDDDYIAEEDEVSDGGDGSEEYCSSFEGNEYLGGLEAEVEGGDDKKAIAMKPKRGSLNRRGNEGKISRNRKRVSYSEEKNDGDLDDDGDDDDDEEFRPDGLDDFDDEEGRTVKKRRVACNKIEDGKDDEEEEEYDFNDDEEEDYDFDDEEFTVKKRRVVCNEKEDGKDDEKEEEYDFNDDEEEDYDFDDEEFTEEADSFDEDEDMQIKKKANKQAERLGLWEVKVQRRKRSRRVIKKTSRKKTTRKANSRRKVKNCDGDGFFSEKSPIMIEESKKTHVRRKKRLIVQSDSDCASSGASDCNFTISEEEREQVREASKLCKTTTVSLKSCSSSKKVEEDVDLKQLRKPPVRKGKEKVEPVKNDIVKQVCGICLSKEGIRTVRGTLNCCSHYFCFACIMEWSKVESRCPLCKQRFITISKPARSNAGIDLRDVVTQVPQRDQIYQPSEEEIRGYLDPYEHVMCTECQHNGDDNLMLLCDLCDSPAHTYCVGLGREVPEGNWYCEGCRPVALASLMSQHPLPDQIPIDINISSTSENMEYGLEATTLPSPFSQGGIGGYPFMDGLSSPRAGAGASTVSGRRHIHRQVHSMRARHGNGGIDNNLSVHLGSDYPEFQVDQGIIPYQPPRTPIAGTSYYNLVSHPSTVQDGGNFHERSNNFTRHMTLEPGPTASDLYEISQLQPGINLIPDHGRHYHFSNGSIMDSDRNISLYAKELVQSIVQSYLESISRNMVFDQDISVIAKRSIHTILAACGFEYETSEVCLIQPQLFSKCSHVERQTSLMIGYCSSCFGSFVRQVVKTIWNEHCPVFLWVRD